SHAGRNTPCADFTKWSSNSQAMSLSLRPFSARVVIFSSKWPDLMMSEMMIGLDVAPVMPSARNFVTSSGSTESSHTFVPQAIRDFRDMGSVLSFRVRFKLPDYRATAPAINRQHQHQRAA